MSTMAGLAELAEQSVPVGDLLEAVLSRAGYTDALEAEALGGAEKTIEAQGRDLGLHMIVDGERRAPGVQRTGKSEVHNRRQGTHGA